MSADHDNPEPTEDELWHALHELMWRIPSRAQRTMVLAAGVRSALYERMGQPTSLEAELTNEKQPISDAAERTLAFFREDPPFSLPRLQARTAMRRLEKELQKWPAEQRADLIREMREKLERRWMALGEVQPADAAQGQQWLNEAIESADRGEFVTQAEMEIADAERRGRADTSDLPRWGQITELFRFTLTDGRQAMSVWDGAICWPVDTAQSVAGEIGLGALVWFRPVGEWAVIEKVKVPGETDPG